MQTTSNLGLKLPGGTDVVDIEELSNNFEKLEQETVKKASPSADGRMSKEDKKKLDGIEPEANNYEHPPTHPATMIVQNSTHRYVTDAEKSTWNGKSNDDHEHEDYQIETNCFNIDAASSRFSGSKKNDDLCWGGKCCYATTSSSEKTLTETKLYNLRFNQYFLVVRLKTANNSLSSGVVTVEVSRKKGLFYNVIESRTIKGNEFKDTSTYRSFYMPFEYSGPKAPNNEIKIRVGLLSVSSSFEVALDSISIGLVGIGVFK